MTQKIPAATIGTLAQILPIYYTHSGIDGLFLTASAPDSIPVGSKADKVSTWLRKINAECEEPLVVLGSIIDDFMVKEDLQACWGESSTQKMSADKEKIQQILAKDGLQYSRGGHITDGTSPPTILLQENVTKNGLKAIQIEIDRSLANVEKDPIAAVHNAGCAVEATLKAYMTHCKVNYKEESDTLSDLWKKTVEHIGIHPKELDDKDLKKIANGLFSIVDGTMHLRNKKGSSHGKSEMQTKRSTIRPRHARLAINSAYTISAYILELMEQKA
jgi:hypothetical protein